MNPITRYIFFGASSVQGVGDPEGGFVARFAQWRQSLEPSAEIINAGIGGQTTVDMKERLEVWEPQPQTVGLILLGCNDFPRHPDPYPQSRTTPEVYSKNLETILIAAKQVPLLFATSFPVDPLRRGIPPERFETYIAIAKKLAHQLSIPVLDWHHEFISKKLDAYWADDGVHLNAKGHQWMFENVRKAFSERQWIPEFNR